MTKFEKVYTRDFSVIMEEAWQLSMEFYRDLFNLKIDYISLYFMNDGVIEVWENLDWTRLLKDTILDKNKVNNIFFTEILDRSNQIVSSLKNYWEKGFTNDPVELNKFVGLVRENMPLFDVLYYSALDERTPKEIRDKALEWRKTDMYFDSSDRFIRKSLLSIFPNLKGYETVIWKSEFENPPSVEILKERKKNLVFTNENNSQIITLEKYESNNTNIHFNIEKPLENTIVVKGQIGNKGYAKGVVRIMKRKEQIVDAQEGDILVSTMTTPDFISAMQKAAAIVTDEGGITCHAAIVARELNKPCIIGTKFGTQILKDGDIVEVDANSGVVKIIS